MHTGGFPDGTVVRNPPANAGDARDTGLILGVKKKSVSGRSFGPSYPKHSSLRLAVIALSELPGSGSHES